MPLPPYERRHNCLYSREAECDKKNEILGRSLGAFEGEKLVTSSDVRNFRKKTSKGGDFEIFSEFKRIPLQGARDNLQYLRGMGNVARYWSQDCGFYQVAFLETS